MNILHITQPFPSVPTPSFVPVQSFPEDLLLQLRGPSEPMARLWSQIKVVAPHFRTLLLTGERGSGAETVARLLQTLSPHGKGRFLSFNVAQDPDGVAKRLRSPRRLLQGVAGGVLYLHEVDRLSPEAQADLLRFLRLNRHHLCALIAFSSRDLRSLVVADGFSDSLAEYLGSFSISLPALRERRGDIPLLAESCLREACLRLDQPVPQLSEGFLQEAMGLEWPGNLDQLRAVMELLAGSSTGAPLEAADLNAALVDWGQAPGVNEASTDVRLVKLDQVMQEHIRSVLIACKGNKLRASEILGISRSTLYRMLDSNVSSSFPLLA